jgi:hypothetical protein
MKKLLTLLFMVSPLISFCQNDIIIKHKYYTLDYDTVLKSPLISFYIQTKSSC